MSGGGERALYFFCLSLACMWEMFASRIICYLQLHSQCAFPIRNSLILVKYVWMKDSSTLAKHRIAWVFDSHFQWEKDKEQSVTKLFVWYCVKITLKHGTELIHLFHLARVEIWEKQPRNSHSNFVRFSHTPCCLEIVKAYLEGHYVFNSRLYSNIKKA